MALTDNPFIGLPLATIQELQSLYVQVLRDIAKTGKSYAFPGLSLTRADLADVKKTLAELRIAVDFTGGRIRQVAQVTINTSSKFTGRGPLDV